MTFFQTRDVVSSESLRLVEELGGKAGLLEFIRDKVPSLADAIVSGEYYSPTVRDETVAKMKRDGYQGNSNLLLRSSHPDDVTAYIGRLPTTSLRQYNPDFFATKNLDNYVKRLGIRGPDHSGILVVPKKDLAFRGNIVEHPNQPGVYIISEAFEIENQTLCTSSIRCEDGYKKAQSYIKPAVDSEMAKRIIGYYLQSRESGWINDDMTGQMEFGIDAKTGKIYIFQFRAFRKKETSDWKNVKGQHRYVFGITPEEGEMFSIKHIVGGDYSSDFSADEGMFRSQNYGNIHKDIPLERIGLFISSPCNALSLEHDVYEACMYTRIAILGYHELDERTIDIPQNIQVFSDGERTKINNMDEKDLSFEDILAKLSR